MQTRALVVLAVPACASLVMAAVFQAKVLAITLFVVLALAVLAAVLAVVVALLVVVLEEVLSVAAAVLAKLVQAVVRALVLVSVRSRANKSCANANGSDGSVSCSRGSASHCKSSGRINTAFKWASVSQGQWR